MIRAIGELAPDPVRQRFTADREEERVTYGNGLRQGERFDQQHQSREGLSRFRACRASCANTNYYRVSVDRLLSRGFGDFVGPGMDDGVSVDVIEVGQDSALELGLGCDTDVTEHRSRHFGQEAFDEIEP